jgi:hypothetical protein
VTLIGNGDVNTIRFARFQVGLLRARRPFGALIFKSIGSLRRAPFSLIGATDFDGAGSATAALYGVPGWTDLDGSGCATAATYDSDVDAATILIDSVVRPIAPGLTNRAVGVTVLTVLPRLRQ